MPGKRPRGRMLGGHVVLLLFGPPGSGQGTQSAMITRWLGIPAISTGEMLRAEIEAGTKLGKTVSDVLAKGELASDDLVNRILQDRISKPDCRNGFLLDGYPRTVPQAQFLEKALKTGEHPSPLVLHLKVPASLLKRRMGARRQCSSCGRIYNLISGPPAKKGHCDDDGAPLILRRDDNEETIRQRLAAYEEWTRPVLEFYGDGAVHHLDGTLSPEEVFAQAEAILEPHLVRVTRRRIAR